MEEFEKERNGDIIHHSIKSIIDMILKFKHSANDDTDFYKELEEMLVKETSRYYSLKGAEYLKEYTCAEYLQTVENIVEQEKFRIEKYMPESSFDRYLIVIQDELLIKNINLVFEKPTGIQHILQNHIVKDMKLIYKLYRPLQK